MDGIGAQPSRMNLMALVVFSLSSVQPGMARVSSKNMKENKI